MNLSPLRRNTLMLPMTWWRKHRNMSAVNWRQNMLRGPERWHTVMAIRYPAWFKDVAGREIEEKLCRAADLQYLLKGKSGGEAYQFPRNGWATGTVADIANAVHVGTVPSERIDDAAEQLERAVNIAAQQLDEAVTARPAIGDSLEHILHQERGTQTSRMACLIITDAFVFQSSLAGKDLQELAGDNTQALKKGLTAVKQGGGTRR